MVTMRTNGVRSAFHPNAFVQVMSRFRQFYRIRKKFIECRIKAKNFIGYLIMGPPIDTLNKRSHREGGVLGLKIDAPVQDGSQTLDP